MANPYELSMQRYAESQAAQVEGTVKKADLQKVIERFLPAFLLLAGSIGLTLPLIQNVIQLSSDMMGKS